MSKKKNPKRNPNFKQQEPEKKVKKKPGKKVEKKVEEAAEGSRKSTKIIIAAAIAIVVAALVLVGIFVVKPAIENKEEPTTVSLGEGTKNEGENYTYVEYKGARMATELAEILNLAQADAQKSINQYGEALKLGDRKISKSELAMYYLDEYRMQVYEVDYAIEQRGSNVTGYDPMILPDEQKYITGDMTWAEEFTQKAISAVQNSYSTFDEALKNGFTLTEPEIYDLIQTYSRIETYILGSDTTVDEYVENVYGDGVTYALFSAREIIHAYASKYEQAKIAEYQASYTEEKLDEIRAADESSYQIVKARVYPIEGEYEPSEVSKINTEAEFLDFAVNNYPNGNYNAEVRSQCFYYTKKVISSTYGTEVGEWLFSKDRVAGEIDVVTGQLYDYLVYIEKLPFYGTSCDVIAYEYPLSGSETNEEIKEIYEEVKALYDDWSAQNMTPDEFRKAVNQTAYGSEGFVRTMDYYFQINNWLFDEVRNSGDMEFFADTSGLYIIYYVENNEDDYDWKQYIRDEMSVAQYNEEHDALVEESYEVERNDDVIRLTWKTANRRITYNINKSKESATQG